MKKVAPIIIVLLLCNGLLIYLCSIVVISFMAHSLLLSVFLGILALGILCIIIALIVTLISRIKEIDKEDADDLSKY